MHLRKPAKLLGFFESLRILAHLLKMMIGVYNHLLRKIYLGSMKPFSEGDWIPRECYFSLRRYFFVGLHGGKDS